MERFELNFFKTEMRVWLFSEVKNGGGLKKALVEASRSKDAAEQRRLDWAFLDASMITSLQHLVTAVCQALVSRSHGSLKTKTLHSEILWTLSPGSNIMEAIKTFGIGDQTSALLLVKLQPMEAGADDEGEKEDVDEAARRLVDGRLVSLDQLGKSTTINWKALRRLYKLNEDPVIKELAGDDVKLHAMMDQIITSTVALKSVAA
ncbi:uncharacterized protein VP01_1878g6 [Puccinia sorghi]|uniref:EKC/KEOPS complex subunit CGI121 n=1 Tax=Puccinia sorghi TaxID=27349 RepID=A0A0L6VEZ4_9BASI|nr:uncharacterized protein VP01_1878g6 [Puccinia sorghi]